MALRSPKTGPWLAAVPPRGRALYEGVQAPGARGFFQKTSPVLIIFSKIYYARIVKSPLIPALVTSLRLRVSTPGPALSAAPASCSLAHRIIGLRRSHGDDHSLRHPLPSLDFKIQALSATLFATHGAPGLVSVPGQVLENPREEPQGLNFLQAANFALLFCMQNLGRLS